MFVDLQKVTFAWVNKVQVFDGVRSRRQLWPRLHLNIPIMPLLQISYVLRAYQTSPCIASFFLLIIYVPFVSHGTCQAKVFGVCTAGISFCKFSKRLFSKCTISLSPMFVNSNFSSSIDDHFGELVLRNLTPMKGSPKIWMHFTSSKERKTLAQTKRSWYLWGKVPFLDLYHLNRAILDF